MPTNTYETNKSLLQYVHMFMMFFGTFQGSLLSQIIK